MDHISICICTYKRPQLLFRLLNTLECLVTKDLFTFSVVVVDNDELQSGQNVIQKFSTRGNFEINYHFEPVRGISHARNRAVKNARGNLIAFIDDDEFPEKDWLINLFKTLKKENCDGVLGPVKPHFEGNTPSWIIKSKVLERDFFETGDVISDARYTRTGNVLLKQKLFSNIEQPFDINYGKTGGSDVIFFRNMMQEGCVFVWCNEAIVYETVVPERQTRVYHIKRSFTRGMTSARPGTLISFNTIKSILAVQIYTLFLPFLIILGHHLFMRYLLKDCDHLGKLLAYLGIRIVKERPY